MNKSVNSLFNLNEYAERHNSYNFTVNYVADVVFTVSQIPRLGLKLFITDWNFLVFVVDFKNDKFVNFTDFQNIGHIFRTSPAEVGNMSKAVKTVYGHKRAETGRPFNFAFNNVADCNICKKFFFFRKFCCVSRIALFLKNYPLRSDNFFLTAVFLNFYSAKS